MKLSALPARPMVAILATALLLRLLWSLAIPVVPVSDSAAYDAFAQSIAGGGSYGWEPDHPSAYWPVGTSALYAIFFYVFGHHYLPVVLFQVLEGVAVVAFGMSLARRWFGEKPGVATGWLLACWPTLIQYTTLLASELHFMLFILAAFWLGSIPGRRTIVSALLAGVALAAASYIRPLALLMAPLVYSTALTGPRPRLPALLACGLSVVSMLACIAPWTVRNWHVFDRFVLISTNGGANLWMGNNPHAGNGYMELPELGIRNEADRDSHLGREARKYILADPVAFLGRAARKTISLHDRESIGVAWNERGIAQRLGPSALTPLKLASSLYWWVLLVLAAYGMYRLGTAAGLAALLLSSPLLAWGYFTLIHAATVAGDRYHVPSIPFVATLAAYGLCAHLRPRQVPRPLAPD